MTTTADYSKPPPPPSRPPSRPPTTNPPPTKPPKQGHLPIGIEPAYPLPRLGEVVRDAERGLRQVLAVLRRDFDPASAPPEDGDPVMPGHVFIRLLSATADVRSALHMLAEIAACDLPPFGSAVPVRFPGRPMPPVPAGERRSPGSDAGGCYPPASESDAAAVLAAPSQATSFQTAGATR